MVRELTMEKKLFATVFAYFPASKMIELTMEKNLEDFTSGHTSLHSRHASAAKQRVFTDKGFSPEKYYF